MRQQLFNALVLACMLVSTRAFAQEYKRNNNWAVGAAPIIIFNFNTPTISFDTLLQVDGMIEGSCISDTNGNFLFFSNGFNIGDKFGFLMENGHYVNCPQGTLYADNLGGGGHFDQSTIIIPKKNNQYYVFSTGLSDSAFNNIFNNGIYVGYDVLNYSIVDMDSNAGLGKVTVKNKVLLDKQEYVNVAMTAVRHGNGKDWWLVKADCLNHRYQSFLVKEDTIEGPYYYNITDTENYCAFYTQIYFSNDGTKFVSDIYNHVVDSTYWNISRVDVYDFDRCSGAFTFNNYYLVPADTVSYPADDFKAGICFSPDSKLLYLSNNFTIYQIDLEDTNKNNALFITGPDTSINYFPWYSTMACAPDGKLYVGNWNGIRPFMSYIDSPNVKGLGCHFVPQGLWQPYTNLLKPPNMTNYGLGWNGMCSPASNAEVERSKQEIVIYPNPTNDKLTIALPTDCKKVEVIIYDMLGQVLLKRSMTQIQNDKIELSVKHLPRALYSIKINVDGKGFVSKFVKE